MPYTINITRRDMDSDWRSVDLSNPTEEHAMLRAMIRSFVSEEVEPQALEYDKFEKFNQDLFRKLGDYGLLGISVPEDYGGSGMDATAVAIVNEELSYSDPGFCLAYLAHSQLMVNNLAYNGNEEQKNRILPKVCSGEWIGCMAMSEPGYGTDVLGMQTSAKLNSDGNWVVNGRKMWITNGSIDDESTPADICWLYARTGTDSKGRAQITTFLVEKGMPGFSVGQKIYDKSGMRASNTAELVFDNCIVPPENIVGSPGESMIHMMRNLEIERIGLAAMAVGIARRSLDAMNKYASEREAFGKKLKDFSSIRQDIAKTACEINQARLLTLSTADKIDRFGAKAATKLISMIKITIPKMACQVIDRAIQAHGGMGVSQDTPLASFYVYARAIRLADGPDEVHMYQLGRNLIKDHNN